MSPASLRRKALRILLWCTSLWAISFPVMKALMLKQQGMLPGGGTWLITSLCVALRFLIAGGLLLIVYFPRLRTVNRREMEQGLWLALIVSAAMCFQMDGVAYVPASTGAFLTQLYCVLIPIWLALRHRKFPAPKVIFCTFLVLLGMALLVNLNPMAIRLGRGELEILASSVLFTAQILCVEHPRYAGNRADCFTTVMLLAIGLFAAPLVILAAPDLAQCVRLYQSFSAWGLLVTLALVCSIAPFLMMNRWQRDVTATEAGLVYCAEPVVVSLLSLFLPAFLSQWCGVNYPDEHLTLNLLLGGALVTIANILLQICA